MNVVHTPRFVVLAASGEIDGRPFKSLAAAQAKAARLAVHYPGTTAVELTPEVAAKSAALRMAR